jgi:hypothetical protein
MPRPWVSLPRRTGRPPPKNSGFVRGEGESLPTSPSQQKKCPPGGGTARLPTSVVDVAAYSGPSSQVPSASVLSLPGAFVALPVPCSKCSACLSWQGPWMPSVRCRLPAVRFVLLWVHFLGRALDAVTSPARRARCDGGSSSVAPRLPCVSPTPSTGHARRALPCPALARPSAAFVRGVSAFARVRVGRWCACTFVTKAQEARLLLRQG